MNSPKSSATELKIHKVLQAAERPLSAYELLDKLRKDGVRSPPTVYRALEKLQGMGLVHRVESLNAFVACCASCEGHDQALSPFAICSSCGKVQEIHDQTVLRAISKLGRGFLAQINHKVLEISGLCHACQEKKGAQGHV